VNRGRRALLQRLLDCGTATVDDVRAVVELPVAIDPKCFGAVPRSLARAKIIRAVGFAPTTRPAGHARPITLWDAPTRSDPMQACRPRRRILRHADV
jgi:hypothetical protein